MPQIILDASITLAWLFDEGDARTRVQPVIEVSSLVAPALWQLEVTNAILVNERRKKLTKPQAARLLKIIDDLPIDLVPDLPSRTATTLAQIARPHQFSAYDAVYLDLAQRLAIPLFTRDNNLTVAAARVGVELVLEYRR